MPKNMPKLKLKLNLQLRTKEKEINFYERYFYDPEAEERKRMIVIAVIPLAIMLILILGIFGYLKISDAVHKHQTTQIQEYLDSADIAKKTTQVNDLQQQRDDLSSTYDAMNTVISGIDALPGMDGAVMGRVKSALSGAKVMSYTYSADQGALVIVAKTSTASAVPGLVKRLKSIGDFATVSHTGYEDSDSKYVATISCVMFK